MSSPILILPYSAQWPEQFAAEKAVLETIFPASEFRIEHIGSTSVPGLGAKPIVDILLGGPSLAAIEARIPAMQPLGYEYVPKHEAVLPMRRFFAKPLTRPRNFHVHAVTIGVPFWVEHLLFRDALRADSRLMAEYFALKTKLATQFVDDVGAYTNAKGPFIQSVVKQGQEQKLV